jgi:hypothetical protein
MLLRDPTALESIHSGNQRQQPVSSPFNLPAASIDRLKLASAPVCRNGFLFLLELLDAASSDDSSCSTTDVGHTQSSGIPLITGAICKPNKEESQS